MAEKAVTQVAACQPNNLRRVKNQQLKSYRSYRESKGPTKTAQRYRGTDQKYFLTGVPKVCARESLGKKDRIGDFPGLTDHMQACYHKHFRE